MIKQLFNILFGERSIVALECQVNDTTAPDTKAKDGMMKDKDKDLSDIDRLEKQYGELSEGKIIQTTLQELLVAVPRHRARTDAYDSLVKKLQNQYGVKLIITSRKKNKTLKTEKP